MFLLIFLYKYLWYTVYRLIHDHKRLPAKREIHWNSTDFSGFGQKLKSSWTSAKPHNETISRHFKCDVNKSKVKTHNENLCATTPQNSFEIISMRLLPKLGRCDENKIDTQSICRRAPLLLSPQNNCRCLIRKMAFHFGALPLFRYYRWNHLRRFGKVYTVWWYIVTTVVMNSTCVEHFLCRYIILFDWKPFIRTKWHCALRSNCMTKNWFQGAK